MQQKSITETLHELKQTSLQLALGFERMVAMDRAERADALREASAVLIEMRRTTDDLGQRVRYDR